MSSTVTMPYKMFPCRGVQNKCRCCSYEYIKCERNNLTGNYKIVEQISLPPVTVKVANSYSATEKPALLCAVTLRLYHVAGFKSKTTKFPPAFTLLDTNVQS